jgi:replicative DNA helicase
VDRIATLPEVLIGTLYLSPETLFRLDFKPEWVQGEDRKVVEWMIEQIKSKPGAKVQLAVCPHAERIRKCIKRADASNIEAVVTQMKDRFLNSEFERILHDTIAHKDLQDPQREILRLAERLTNIVDQAEDARPSHISADIEDVLELIASRMETYQSGQSMVGIPTGNPKLDAATGGFELGDLIVLAGRPGMGKTTEALNFAMSAARGGFAVDVYSLEMNRKKLLAKMVTQMNKLSLFDVWRGRTSDQEFQKIVSGMDLLRDFPIFANDNKFRWLDIKSSARRNKALYDTKMIVVDYLQLIEGESRSNRNREQEISKISREMKLLAQELDCVVVNLSQLNRKVEDRTDKRPRISDLRESGSIEQDADMIMFPFRPCYYWDLSDDMCPHDGTEFMIEKFRMGDKTIVYPEGYSPSLHSQIGKKDGLLDW